MKLNRTDTLALVMLTLGLLAAATGAIVSNDRLVTLGGVVAIVGIVCTVLTLLFGRDE